jgi:hypothetical protein
MLRRAIIPLFITSLALLFCLQGSASATPVGVVNGATQLNVTSFGTLTSLGITISPGGTAEVISIPALPSPIVFYDVTSVDLDPSSTQIFHVGSVLDLTRDANTVSLSNFLIDATQGLVFADVLATGFDANAAVFSISKACSVADPCSGLDGTATIDGLELQLTSAAGGLLADQLSIADLTGSVIAVANSSFTPVPEPGTALLMALGLGGLSAAGRRPRS